MCFHLPIILGFLSLSVLELGRDSRYATDKQVDGRTDGHWSSFCNAPPYGGRDIISRTTTSSLHAMFSLLMHTHKHTHTHTCTSTLFPPLYYTSKKIMHQYCKAVARRPRIQLVIADCFAPPNNRTVLPITITRNSVCNQYMTRLTINPID